MIIMELLDSLNYLSDDTIIKNIKLDGSSDRGNYEDFCLQEQESELGTITVKELKDFLINNVIGKTFKGYKGGDFGMDKYSTITLGYPDCGGRNVDGILINSIGVKIKVQKTLYY